MKLNIDLSKKETGPALGITNERNEFLSEKMGAIYDKHMNSEDENFDKLALVADIVAECETWEEAIFYAMALEAFLQNQLNPFSHLVQALSKH